MVNPHNANIEASKTEVVMAASAIGVDLKVVEASDSREIEMAFTALVDNRVDALVVGPDSMFFNRRVQITTLARVTCCPPFTMHMTTPKSAG
jgi:ABC-type uncharacterized transport system substrate-binding protein